MLRKICDKDLPACSKLICQVIQEIEAKYYSPEVITGWQDYNSLSNLKEEAKNTEFIVYEKDERILGVGAIAQNHIKKVYVSPAHQKKGIGRSLVDCLEQIAKEKGFRECELNSTVNALDFYKHLGYKEQGPIIIEKNKIIVTFTRMTKQI